MLSSKTYLIHQIDTKLNPIEATISSTIKFADNTLSSLKTIISLVLG